MAGVAAVSLIAACAPAAAPPAPTQAPAKPAEAKPADAKPAAPAAPPAATKPAESKPAESKPAAAQPAAKRTKLTYAWPFAATTQAFQEDLVKRFMEQHKAIEVEVEVIPQAQVLPKLTTAYSSGAGPDVVAMSPAWVSQFAAGGFLENLEDRVKSTGIDKELLPVAMTQGRLYKNTAYMVGCIVDVYPLFYNKVLFAEAGISGPPTTLEEFAQYAKKLTDPSKNRFGYYQLGSSGWDFQQWSTWMLNHGGIGANNSLYDANNKAILNGPKHVAGLERWLAMYKEDKVSPPASATSGFNEASNAFNAGQIGMVFGFLGYIGNFRKGLGADKFGVALFPSGPAGQFLHYGVNGYAIGSKSEHKDAAWELIRWMLSPEINNLVNKEWGAIPSNLKALEADWLNDPHYQAPKAAAQKSDAHVHTPRQLADWAKFTFNQAPEQVQKAMLGQQNAQQAADSLASSLNEALAKG